MNDLHITLLNKQTLYYHLRNNNTMTEEVHEVVHDELEYLEAGSTSAKQPFMLIL